MTTEQVVAFQTVMGPLAQALGLSVAVERIIEFGKNSLQPWFGAPDTRAPPDPASAEESVARLTELATRDAASRTVEQAAESQLGDREARSAELQDVRAKLLAETDSTKRTELLRRAAALRDALTPHEKAGEWDEQVSTSVLLVEKATDQDDGWTLRGFVLQLIGLATGILLANFTDLRLFTAFLAPGVIPADWTPPLTAWVDHVLTGLFIGGGSGPVHTLIQFISDRKTTVQAADLVVAERPEQKVPIPPVAPAIITTPSDAAADGWSDVPYEGGVNVAVLQSIHRRDANPNLVVYHHTAMSSDSSFDDVVHVIKSRTDADKNPWLTGYNCVILADGSIHAFCRWDRYGNHAVGYNRRSLGISFNGNFETNPAVPYSNPDGRYGAARPSDTQLRAGARVVALWTFLYPVPVDFASSIIPHKQIASKACPGSNFPYDEFKRLVMFYRHTWELSPLAQARIAAFKLKPYLYV